MEQKLILSGIGGQGIVMMGQYLGYAAIKRGAKVTLAPSYGQEKRGSYVHCQLIIGDTLAAPSISAADAVFPEQPRKIGTPFLIGDIVHKQIVHSRKALVRTHIVLTFSSASMRNISM